MARAIGGITELPVEHIDQIHWQPGWQERSPSEKVRLSRQVHARQQWIFEGGLSATWDERVSRADMLIWLNFPLWFRAFRVIRRTMTHHGQTRVDLPADCPERFNWEFTSWIWNTRHSGRLKMQRFYDQTPPDTVKHQLCTPSQVTRFLTELEAEYSGYRPDASRPE